MKNSERLKITDEIRALMACYARFADTKQFKKLALLFTPDGIFTPLDTKGDPLTIIAGRSAIEATIASAVSTSTAIHHLFSYEVKIESPTRATGIFAMEDYIFRDEKELVSGNSEDFPVFRSMHGFGHYHADCIKAGGNWFLSKLVLTRLKLEYKY
jgi:hypothetical protein